MQQDYRVVGTIRASAVLTNAYVAATDIDAADNVSLYNQFILLIKFTIGSLTDLDIKVEFSHDGTTWYQETFENISGAESTESLGHHTYAATGNYVLAVPLKYNKIRVSAIGNGTVTSSLLQLDAFLGVQ